MKELQNELAALAKEEVSMDQIRSEENSDYLEATEDLEFAISGVQKEGAWSAARQRMDQGG